MTGYVKPRSLKYSHDIILFVVAFVLYGQTLMNGFVGDDYIFFIGNEHLASFDLWTILARGAIGVDYCPLRDLSFAVDYLIWGENPFGFHLTSVLLYGITVVSVKYLYVSFSDMLSDRVDVRADSTMSEMQAFLASLLFAIHPVHREVVYAVYNRGAILATLFFILACIAFIRHLRNSERKGTTLFISFVLCILTFMSREYGIILPLALLILVLFHSPSRTVSGVARTIPFFIAAAVFYHIFKRYAVAASYIRPEAEPFSDMLLSRLGTAIKVIVYYPLRMAAFEMPINRFFGEATPALVLMMAGMVVATIIAAAFISRHHPRLLFSLLLYLACLIPVMNFFKTDPVVSDRYVYLPSLGLFFAITALPFQGWKRFVPVTSVIVVAVWVAVTIPQTAYWKDDVSYWFRFAPVYRYPSLYARLGAAHFRAGNHDAGKEAFFLARSYSGNSVDDLRIGDLCLKIGYHEGAVLAYEAALRKSEGEGNDFPVGLHVNLAKAYYNTGHYTNALKCFKEAIRLDPENAMLHGNIGALHAETGNYPAAVKALETAISLDPEYGQAFLNLSRVYREMGEGAKADAYGHILKSRFPHMVREP